MFRAAFAVSVVALIAAQPAPGSSCVGLSAPLTSEVIAPYEPIGRYAGHWGVDYAEVGDELVRAAASGVVTFSGTVVDNRTVTIDHGGGLRTSYSYTADVLVGRGAWVARGDPVAVPSDVADHGSLHFSVRVNGQYVDPQSMLGCRSSSPSSALRLVPVP